MEIKEQKKAKAWLDEKGIEVPYNRVSELERHKERAAVKVAQEALKVSERLEKFKELCTVECERAYQMDLAAGKAASKGGYTMYNFNRSVRVERSFNEKITFDENLIGAAKEKFDQFLKEGITGVEDIIRQLISDAFSSTRKGKLDSKKILNLLSYRSRISANKYPSFHEALTLIEDSIRKPESKIYYRVFLRKPDGSYEHLDLNFSNI